MGNRISEYRKQLKLSQVELANKVGISREYVSLIENGKKVPSTLLGLVIAKVLKTTVEELFISEM